MALFIASTTYAQTSNTRLSQTTLAKKLTLSSSGNTAKTAGLLQSSRQLTTQPTFNCSDGKSYLFQGDDNASATTLKSNTEVYVLNLTNGVSTKAHGQLLTGNNTSINNVGFNTKDNYIWGYVRGSGRLVRIGSDWSTQLFSVTPQNNTIDPLATNIPYNAGDIDKNGIMYLYYGKDNVSPSTIRRINLTTQTLLSDLTLTSSRTIDYMIDIAYNPVDNYLYGIDGSTEDKGNNNFRNHLYRINPSTGTATDLGNIGITGNNYPFGAAYFDNEGTLYISQNLTGYIYKIKNVSNGDHSAQFLRKGPKTNDNDGARCSNSPVPLNISGKVFDDANGLVDGTVNGTAVSGLSGNTFHVNLIGIDGKVLATTPLTDGIYSFTGLTHNTSYSVVLTNSAGTLGATLPNTATTLSNNVVNTGENIGLGSGSDGTPNGVITVTLTDDDKDDVNFGVDKKPVADNKTATSQANPGGSTKVPVPTLTGVDLEDGAYTGSSKSNTVVIQNLPANATLYYNNTAITSAGTVIPNYDPSKLLLDPNDGPISVTFTYSERDAAAKDSPPAIVTIPFGIPDLTPVIYARPSSIYNTKPITVVVEVYELNAVTTNGLITVKLSKDPKVTLSFPSMAASVGGITVQNSAWSFDDISDDDYYVLTTNQSVAAGDILPFGLAGSLTPGATSGTLTFTTVLGPGSGGEVLITNNTDADKIDFFQQ